MRLIDLKCSNCGADMKVNPELKQAVCNYCGKSMLVDDEIKKMEMVNGFNYGYDIERGRIAAKKEQDLKEATEVHDKKVAKLTVWAIILVIMIILIIICDNSGAKVGIGIFAIIPFSYTLQAIKECLSTRYRMDKLEREVNEMNSQNQPFSNYNGNNGSALNGETNDGIKAKFVDHLCPKCGATVSVLENKKGAIECPFCEEVFFIN